MPVESLGDDQSGMDRSKVRSPPPTAWRPSEDLFREAFAHAAVGMAVMDLAGRFLLVNPAFCGITGYARPELFATDLLALTHPDDSPETLDRKLLLLAGDIASFDIETRFVSKNGEVVWVLNSISLRRDEQGRPTHCIALCQDISQRKRAERERDRLLVREQEARAEVEAALRALEESRAALRASEEEYRSLADLVPGVVWTARPDGWIDYANQFWVRYTGLTLDQTYGWGWKAALHTDDLARVMDFWDRSLRAGEQVDVEYRLRRGCDGAYRWFLARGIPMRGPEGRIVKWFGLLTDIESQKQADEERARLLVQERQARAEAETAIRVLEESREALQASEEQYRSLAESIPQLVWTARPDGWIDYFNQRSLNYSGLTLEQSQGAGWLSTVHPEDLQPCLDLMARALQTGEVFEFEFRLKRADASYRWHLARGLPVRDRDGRIVKWFGTCTDIDDQKQAAAELQAAKQAAETANWAKSEFLSRMSHELRTPLNAILGFGQLLEMGSPTPRQRQQLEQILKGGRHLLGLINEVLDLARIETGGMHLSLGPVSLRHVCAEVCDLVRPLAEQHSIRVDALCAETPDLHVVADSQRLKQVLLNLVANGVKYNHPGGRVSLTWDELPDGRVRLAVHDTGPGIAPEMRERLFNPFDRLGAEATAVEGTGLGLVLSKRLTEAMGGTLDVAGTVGRGTTFVVDLPRATPPARPVSRPVAAVLAPAAASPRRWTILHIEDNRANLDLMEDIFAYRPEFQLLPAMQGSIGLELARQHHPDLILLDVHLPDMGGDEVLHHLRSDPRLGATPVIVISADATARQIERLRAAGAWDYLTKPIEVPRLLALLDRFLHEREVRP